MDADTMMRDAQNIVTSLCQQRIESTVSMVLLSLQHQKQCLLDPIPSSMFVGGVIFTGIDAARGAHITPHRVGRCRSSQCVLIVYKY